MLDTDIRSSSGVRILVRTTQVDRNRPNVRVVRPSRGELALSTILLIHERLATTMLLFMSVTGVWGLVSFLRGGTLSGNLAGTFVVGQVLIAAQVIAGATLVARGVHPETSVHYLYGATAVLVLPFAWTYLRDRNSRQALLIYSLLALFIAGLSIRGMTTGG